MKYILKKEYPGSPKLGYIDDLNKSGHNNQGEYVQSMYDKNPEFWEKVVVEKDYEILELSLQRSDKHQIHNVSEYKNTGYIEALLNCNGNKIHSVKRLSDSEIFTIGDKVIDGNIINEFELIDNKLKVWTVHPSYSIPIKPKDNGSITGCGNMSFNWLNNIKKFKQKLFTTEQRSEIEEIIKNIIK